ncbi:MAG: hypothetical protein ACXU7D_03490 [Burkholderiaceae bacterium]
MKTSLIAATGLMTGTALMLCSTAAMAHDRVNWSVSIGAPVYYPPPVVYAPPPVVYEEPVRVYQPAPVVRYAPQPYYAYGYRDPDWRRHEWREHEWREHHRHHDHDRD